jgi:protein SCO1
LRIRRLLIIKIGEIEEELRILMDDRGCSAAYQLTPRSGVLFLYLILAVLATAGLDCDSNSGSISSYGSTEKRDCLPDLALVDQNGRKVSLASFKGKPVLFDFIYTTCPGPCLVLTARMKAIAEQLDGALGPQATFVSVTVDPEHDGPSVLKAYAKEQDADRPGWYFLTGRPVDVDRVMAQFKLQRQREADGSVDHVLEFFLIGADGQALVQYLASDVNPAKVAGDVRDVIAGKRLAIALYEGSPSATVVEM